MRSALWRVETRRAPCPGWPPGQGAQRSIGAPKGASGGLAASGAGAAPLAANASHLKVHNTL
ncbi:hypothetical protein xavtCFBP7764_16555 [Xanthomonas citri]|nr:hypothetical protein xavtCFBP7764_16555 [Xanthomonas citri]